MQPPLGLKQVTKISTYFNNMKICAKCKYQWPLNQFSKNKTKKDGLSSTCKRCHKLYIRKWYLNNQEKYKINASTRRLNTKAQARKLVWNYLLNHQCVDCGNNPVVLEFDHKSSSLKINDISTMINSGAIIDEIKKCEVRCANCHKIKTYKQCNSWRITFSKNKTPL